LKLSPSQMKTVRHQFDSICRKVLRDESRNYKKQLARRAEKETNLSELSEAELGQLYAMDEYPSDSTYFDVLEYRVGVKDERLAEALAALPSKKRDVILLSYFLDMNDTEIAEKLKVVGATIHYRRTSSLKELKLRLEVKEDGQSAE
jgi:RNA polymerase sigma factor (sigma-70 family)